MGYFNSYEGGMPPEIGKLTNIVRLDMSACNLFGPLPPKLGNMVNLDTMAPASKYSL